MPHHDKLAFETAQREFHQPYSNHPTMCSMRLPLPTASTEAVFPLWPNRNIMIANCSLTGICETFALFKKIGCVSIITSRLSNVPAETCRLLRKCFSVERV